MLRKIEDDAHFLFGDEIHTYIKQIIDKGNKKRRLYKKISRLNSKQDPDKEDERIQAIEEEAKLTDWFYNQCDECRKKFYDYLSYDAYLKIE